MRAEIGISVSIALLAGCASAPAAPGASIVREAGVADGSALTESSLDAGLDAPADSDADADADADAHADADADADADDGAATCTVGGVVGQCISTAACAAADAGLTSTPGYCPGPADIECCTLTPNVAANPPVPAGYELMPQSAVTADMTTWAVAILDDPTDYPMFSTTTKMFGTLLVLARVEWHPPDFQNAVVHRGVTLYEPI